MKCEEFIDKLGNLSETDIPQDMEKHMAECDDCREYYSIVSALTPKVYPKTPENIKTNVLTKIKRKEQFKAFFTMKTKISRIAASVAGIAAVVVCIFLIGKPAQAHAAEKLIDKSLSAVNGVKSMVMKIDVRTEPKENYSYIDINGSMVEHTLTIVRGNPTKWRLDKGWRCIVFDGTNKYMWTPDNSINVKGGKNAGFEEWFNILLDPEMVLLKEKVISQDKGTKYSINESGNEIIMKVEANAKGNFTNPYLRNTSIMESDTRREIIFDKQSNLIKSMKIYVKDKSREVLVVDIKSIEYNTPVSETQLTKLPEGRQWSDVDAKSKSSGKFTGITAEEAAKIIFDALENNDTEIAKEAFIQYDLNKVFSYSKGIKVIQLGKSFKSGLYPGVFVPYEVKLPNGDIKKDTIALRNDNSKKEWIIDGGI